MHNGKQVNLRAKTGVFVSPSHFEYYVNRARTEAAGVKVPARVTTATAAEAASKGYVLFGRGEVVVRNRVASEDKDYHEGARKTLDGLARFIASRYEEEKGGGISGAWLQDAVSRFHHPEAGNEGKAGKGRGFLALMEAYLAEKPFSYDHGKGVRVLMRILARWEKFRDMREKGFSLDLGKLTRGDVEAFRRYLGEEFRLSQEFPGLFGVLLSEYPPEVGAKHKSPVLVERGGNTTIKLMKKFKAFYSWLNEKGITANRPFEGVRIGSELYGTPWYLTKGERDLIADADLSDSPGLAVQRDVFVFQCLTGCRVGDLLRLSPANVVGGKLEYLQHKTKDERPTVVSVPLVGRARAIVERYKGADGRGRLLPFISAQKYNAAIKAVLARCGVTRLVTVRNPVTGEEEKRPINELASSHMARRTFVGLLYKGVQDPNVIGSMSGHAEGSRAFARYRKIDEDIQREALKSIE